MADALCIDPGHGSVWLSNAERVVTDEGVFIVGDTWDNDLAGSPADDYMGEALVMNFPESCLLKWEEDAD